MLGIDHTKDAKTTFRQSWSSDEPASSSTSASSNNNKESKSLWSKLRKQASRLHVNNSSPGATPPLPSVAGFSLASRPRTAPSASNSPTIVPSAASPLRSAPNIVDANNAAGRTWSGIPSPRALVAASGSRRSPVRGAFDGSSSRGSADIYRAAPSQLKPLPPPVHSYSMDLPRNTTTGYPLLPPSSQNQQALGPDTAARGMPRLRRLMLLPSRDHSVDQQPASSPGLERIVEDDEVSYPASAPAMAIARPRA
ncbi:hypothetical protein GGI21_001814, partial [Coemansia aciculifera]